MPKPKAKRKKKDQGDTASVSSDCSDTISVAGPCNAVSPWSQMPPLSPDIIPPTPTSTITGAGDVDEMEDLIIVDDSDTFEGFCPALEGHKLAAQPALNAYAQSGSQPQLLQSSTKHSETNTKVVIIEPVADPDGPGARPLSKFFSNEIALSAALTNSPFGKAGIGHISRNPRRQLLVVTMKGDSPEDLTQLLRVTRLGSWNVKCRLPVNQTMSTGVIGPLGEDVSDEELTSVLRDSGHKDLKDARAERILKGKDKIKTPMFKIYISSSTLPEYLYVGYQRYKLNPFVAEPWQCYKCQHFGHSAISCKGAARCVACGGAHSVKDCHNTGGPLCCNCGGPHTANYGGCPLMRQAKQVEKARSNLKVSYRDALKSVRASAPQNPVLTPVTSMTPIVSPAPVNSRVESRRPCPATRTICTQTIDVQAKPTLQNIPVEQFIELFSKLLSICKPNDNTNFLDVATKLIKETLCLEQSPTIQIEPSPLQSLSTEAYHSLDDVPLLELPQNITDEEMSDGGAEPSPVLGAPSRHRLVVPSRKLPATDPAALDGASDSLLSKSKVKATLMTKNVLHKQPSKWPSKKK